MKFKICLVQLIGVTESSAHVIECLEAFNTHPADVYLYWIVMLACLADVLESPKIRIPSDVQG